MKVNYRLTIRILGIVSLGMITDVRFEKLTFYREKMWGMERAVYEPESPIRIDSNLIFIP